MELFRALQGADPGAGPGPGRGSGPGPHLGPGPGPGRGPGPGLDLDFVLASLGGSMGIPSPTFQGQQELDSDSHSEKPWTLAKGGRNEQWNDRLNGWPASLLPGADCSPCVLFGFGG